MESPPPPPPPPPRSFLPGEPARISPRGEGGGPRPLSLSLEQGEGASTPARGPSAPAAGGTSARRMVWRPDPRALPIASSNRGSAPLGQKGRQSPLSGSTTTTCSSRGMVPTCPSIVCLTGTACARKTLSRISEEPSGKARAACLEGRPGRPLHRVATGPVTENGIHPHLHR